MFVNISGPELFDLFGDVAQPIIRDNIDMYKLDPGIYYSLRGYEGTTPMYIMHIVGKCLYQNSKGDCSIWEMRPHACRNFELGDEDCNDIRQEANLPAIQTRG